MKSRFKILCFFGLVLMMTFALASTSPAGEALDLSTMTTDEVVTNLQDKFGSLGLSQKNGGGLEYPDPDDFEFLLELKIDFVDATDELPAFWKFSGKLFPEIKFELWLPPNGEWNQKFYLAGCGGFCGGVDTNFPVGQFTNNIKWGIVRGYASATHDSGHDNLGEGRTYAEWALDNRRGEIDWGYRSTHEVARVCKAFIQLFYHEPPKYSYFAGCSTGGRQAIMQALRFPKDFDGLISGAPALEYTGLVATWMAWIVQATTGVTFSDTEIASVQHAVLDQCDGIDGAEDGLISDPRRCPKVDFSAAGLSDGQLAALGQIYQKTENSLNAVLYEGIMPYGSEIYWPTWVPGVATTPEALGLGLIGPFNGNFLKYMAFQKDDPDLTANDFSFDAHPALLEFMGKIYNATSTNLREFKELGGKMILYHGWADAIVPPNRTIAYYEAVVAAMGGLEKTQEFARLFMVPGMDHCSTAQGLALGGLPFKSIGLDDFDALGALEKWVENNIPPDQIMAKGKTLDGTERSRPLFPYPLYAKYISGDPNDPTSFAPENDGTVRWPRFRGDTFYTFDILEEDNNPFVEGEGVQHFFPYDFSLEMGSYDWQVWSPSMDDEVGTEPGFFGTFEVE
jgi:feruloyl esterase